MRRVSHQLCQPSRKLGCSDAVDAGCDGSARHGGKHEQHGRWRCRWFLGLQRLSCFGEEARHGFSVRVCTRPFGQRRCRAPRDSEPKAGAHVDWTGPTGSSREKGLREALDAVPGLWAGTRFSKLSSGCVPRACDQQVAQQLVAPAMEVRCNQRQHWTVGSCAVNAEPHSVSDTYA